MKTIVKVTEVDGEGLAGLLGKKVLLMCGNYFYAGVLAGVDDTCAKLTDAHIVYETGKFSGKAEYKDAQPLGGPCWYVLVASIESFGERE